MKRYGISTEPIEILVVALHNLIMLTILNIAQVVISILLTVSILIQQRGGGLSSVFGGEGNVYRTRRGVEKGIFFATIFLSVLFLAAAVANILLRR